jgi:hypothetical protein
MDLFSKTITMTFKFKGILLLLFELFASLAQAASGDARLLAFRDRIDAELKESRSTELTASLKLMRDSEAQTVQSILGDFAKSERNDLVAIGLMHPSTSVQLTSLEYLTVSPQKNLLPALYSAIESASRLDGVDTGSQMHLKSKVRSLALNLIERLGGEKPTIVLDPALEAQEAIVKQLNELSETKNRTNKQLIEQTQNPSAPVEPEHVSKTKRFSSAEPALPPRAETSGPTNSFVGDDQTNPEANNLMIWLAIGCALISALGILAFSKKLG